jgi:RNA polymerase sigma factor (sigma-70 family)
MRGFIMTEGRVPPMDDTVLRAMQGDADAFERLVERYQKMAVGYAWSVLRDFHLAQDAAQEAFIRAFMDLRSLREPKAFSSWLRRIVFKQCDRILRRKAPPPTEPEDCRASPQDVLDTISRSETAREVHRAMLLLSEKERESVSLFYIDGYTMAEVGDFLGVPVSTVKNRLFAGRKKLKNGMVDLVMDTLRSNAPGEEFKGNVKRILEGIRSIHWTSSTPICFVGSMLACMGVPEGELPGGVPDGRFGRGVQNLLKKF